jgi:hypothetical protein
MNMNLRKKPSSMNWSEQKTSCQTLIMIPCRTTWFWLVGLRDRHQNDQKTKLCEHAHPVVWPTMATVPCLGCKLACKWLWSGYDPLGKWDAHLTHRSCRVQFQHVPRRNGCPCPDTWPRVCVASPQPHRMMESSGLEEFYKLVGCEHLTSQKLGTKHAITKELSEVRIPQSFGSPKHHMTPGRVPVWFNV